MTGEAIDERRDDDRQCGEHDAGRFEAVGHREKTDADDRIAQIHDMSKSHLPFVYCVAVLSGTR